MLSYIMISSEELCKTKRDDCFNEKKKEKNFTLVFARWTLVGSIFQMSTPLSWLYYLPQIASCVLGHNSGPGFSVIGRRQEAL